MSDIHIPRKVGRLIKVSNSQGTWYGFYETHDKDQDGDLRVKINACLDSNPNWKSRPKIEDNTIYKVSSIELGTTKMQEVYNKLLIEASQWRGDNIF